MMDGKEKQVRKATDLPMVIRSLESGGKRNMNGTRTAMRIAGRMST